MRCFIAMGLVGLFTGCGASIHELVTPGQLIDARTGDQVTTALFVERARRFRHLYVGEQHKSPPHQRVQLAVLQSLYRAKVPIAVGIEWLPAEVQPVIDAWLQGRLTEVEFRKKVNWKQRWGHGFEHYQAIFAWAKANRVPILGLNAPTGLARKVARHGPCGLSKEDQALLPPLDTSNTAHKAYFMQIMGRFKHHGTGHGHHSHRKHTTSTEPCRFPRATGMERYYLAQLVWDEAMSRRAAAFLNKAHSRPVTLVVFAGLGHVDYGLGIPLRVKNLTKMPFNIVLPLKTNVRRDTLKKYLSKLPYSKRRADVLWVDSEPPR
jgi:uncharacterized iron-regulated protein